jgi:DNA end-binding protein Ku
MWKAVVRCGEVSVPVKLYAALEDQGIHFRMLNRADRQPVRQAMVHPDTGEVVPKEQIQKAFVGPQGERVLLAPEELDALTPEASRDIDVLTFVPAGAIDHRWYERPYYLGPDGGAGPWRALAAALEALALEGVARWVMRGRSYAGALRLHQGYPVLIAMRHADAVIPAAALQAPEGPALDAKELAMARQLVGMLAGTFDPAAYVDEYRDRVRDLVETKARGGHLTLVKPRRRRSSGDLGQALRASLKAARRSA